jgi:tetratricopeptide (TPR) repeat protein
MGEQRIEGDRNVQVQGGVGSRIQITYNDATRTVPLEPAHVPAARKLRSPARLIRAHAGVVPYVERGDLSGELEAWIDSEAAFSGQVIGGRGGAGKTRLAVELCQRLRESRWLCGFLTRIADEGMLDALVDVPTPRLVVIDYAETRRGQLQLLLPLLSAKATPESPVRVLLLVRGPSGDGGGWAERMANRVDALDTVLDECEVRRLEDAPFGAAERADLFAAAVPGLVAHLGPGAEPAAPPDLEQAAFESPLMVVIAAYLAALGEEAPTTREGLLNEVLAHERRYWQEDEADLDVDAVLLERLVAIATLLSADSEGQAAGHLRLLDDLCDAPTLQRNRFARWVHAQYPGPGWWNPLEPDLVGEHLVAKCFTDKPDVLRGALSAADSAEITRPLEVLGRAAADHPELAKALGPILNERLVHLCGAAVGQAEAVKDADLLYGRALTVAAAVDALLVAVELEPEALASALSLMPPRADLVLNELAASLTAKEAERLRPLADANPDTNAPRLAGILNNLSIRLSAAGRHPEALIAIEESVATYRPLADASPAAHGPELAKALNTHSNRLAAAGRHPEALTAIEESVATWRPLADADPAAHAPSLAGSLNNHSVRLSNADRHNEALIAIEESVATYRPLADASPAAHGPELAKALGNLADCLSKAGREEEMESVRRETVALLSQPPEN